MNDVSQFDLQLRNLVSGIATAKGVEVYEYGPAVHRLADDFLQDSDAESEPAAKSKRSSDGKATILVVDDHRMVADTTVAILNRQGFHATAAYGGRSALRIVEDLQPDFLLTDVMMPDMNGVELAIEVSKRLPATRILLFSGQTGVTDILRQGEADGYAFELLAKPIHPEKLVEHLKKK